MSEGDEGKRTRVNPPPPGIPVADDATIKRVRLRVVGDGTPSGTYLETEDGALVEDVRSFELIAEVGKTPRLVVNFWCPHVDAITDRITQIDHCGPSDRLGGDKPGKWAKT